MDVDHITGQEFSGAFDRFVARLRRAAQHRESLEQFCTDPSAVTVECKATENTVAVAVRQSAPVPVVASTILSDWLHQTRSALDGAFYTLASLETGSYPPARERTRTFPIKSTQTDFDHMLKSDTNPMKGMSPETIDKIEKAQPYHGKYGSDGDALLWIHDMARIDRHRHSFGLAMRILDSDDPNVFFSSRSPRPVSVTPGPVATPLLSTSEDAVFAVVKYDRPDIAQRAVREAWLKPRFSFNLEASEWYSDAVKRNRSANIRNDGLTARMRFSEWMVAAQVKMLSDRVAIEQLHIPDWVTVG